MGIFLLFGNFLKNNLLYVLHTYVQFLGDDIDHLSRDGFYLFGTFRCYGILFDVDHDVLLCYHVLFLLWRTVEVMTYFLMLWRTFVMLWHTF